MSRCPDKQAWAAARARLAALTVLLLLGGRSAATSCQIPPLVWPLRNQTFNVGALVAVNRGVAVVLGNQTLGLRPTFCWNGTRIRSAQDCESPNATAFNICQGQSGSVYDATQPGAFVTLDESAWSVPDAPPENTRWSRGRAPAAFDSGQTLEIPFEVWSEAFPAGVTPNKSFIALGPSSNVVQAILDAGYAPSNATGVFYGSRSVADAGNGEIVIGGWNAAYVDGPWYNFTLDPPDLPMSIPCPIRVRLTGMTLNNVHGSVSLLAPGETVAACIDMLQNAFTVTEDMFARWVVATNHTSDNPPNTPPYDNQTYAADKEPLMGTLDITLEGGFNTTVPHYELVNPDRGDGADGSYALLNDSRIQSAIETGPTDYGEGFGVLLGGVFGAGVYMLVDYERGTVSLAKANLNPGPQDIRHVCSTNTSVGAAPPANATSPAAPGGGGGGLDAGSIAGIVLGVLGFLAAIPSVWYARLQYLHAVEQRHEAEERLEREAKERLEREAADALPVKGSAHDGETTTDGQQYA